MLNAFVNSDISTNAREGGKVNMCKAITMLKEENFNNGRTEGLNNALENLVISLMETNNLSQEEAEKQARILLRMS